MRTWFVALTLVPLNPIGEMAAFAGHATGTVHLIIDVNGYFE